MINRNFMNVRVSDLTPITMAEMQQLHSAYELADFMDQLLGAMRGIQFGQRDTASVWVYTPEDVMPLGFIAYADYRDSGDQGACFVVCSRTITNNKYAAHSGYQHNMKMTTNIDTAIKHCKKYLRSWHSVDICRGFWGDAKSAWDQAKSNAEAPLNDLKDKVFNMRYGRLDKPHHNELLHLARSGHQFMDAEFHNNINEFVKLNDELSDLHNDHQHTFVRVYQKYGKTWADTMVIENSKYHYGSPELLNIVTYAEEDIPEELLGRVSVLQMMPSGEYVLKVGVNMNDGLFYVY